MLARFHAAAVGGLIAVLVVATPVAAGVGDEPLARFEDPVCPGVVGLKREAAETMVGLIRSNVETLGVGLAREDTCEPNVVIAFVADGQASLRRMAKADPMLFVEVPRHEREAILAEGGPARAVLKVRTRTLTGMPLSRRENLAQIPQMLTHQSNSRITTNARRDIVGALVLIDRGAVRGLSLTQLADYATFRALSRTLPPPAARSASIVGLFDSTADRHAGLTPFDRAFLTTLYEGVPNMPGTAKLAALTEATGVAMPGSAP